EGLRSPAKATCPGGSGDMPVYLRTTVFSHTSATNRYRILGWHDRNSSAPRYVSRPARSRQYRPNGAADWGRKAMGTGTAGWTDCASRGARHQTMATPSWSPVFVYQQRVGAHQPEHQTEE